ncbi:MAG: hypothetical protein K0R34_2464 [Herbinix sp.]|jgi:hypothetical protein|nr:hypothetical protein [Herbinix sp.]
MKKLLSLLLTLTLLFTVLPVQAVDAATKLNKSKLTLDVGDTYKLKLSGVSSNITWSSSNKSVATVSKGKIEAISGGTAVIIAKHSGKQYKCSVTVKDGKTDVVYATYIFDGSSIEDYVKKYKKENPEFIDVKVYDDDHIVVTMWESKRLSMLKEYTENIDEYLDAFISNENYDGVFTSIEADKLLQNIKVYADGEKYENSFAGLGLIMATAILSDAAQSISLIDLDDRKYNLSIIDKDTGEILYPEE